MLSYTRRQEENKSFLLKQFIPARGRKHAYGAQSAAHARNNSSPQGDGNLLISRRVPSAGAKQFIPARGRKPRPRFSIFYAIKKQFIPARGRKHSNSLLFLSYQSKQFIPARGRKRAFSNLKILVCMKQFIPARGRKPQRKANTNNL